MPFYIGENKIVDRYIGDKLVIAAYKGETKYFDAYSEITGLLPIVFKSRAAVALKNYLLHGTSEGAGVETENLCPMAFSHTGVISDSGQIYTLSTRLWSNMIPVKSNEDYAISITGTASNDEYLVFNRVVNYDINRNFISRTTLNPLDNKKTITTASNVAYIVLDIRTPSNNVDIQFGDADTISVVSGSTAPTTYIPFGYKIPLTNTGENSQSSTYPLYIGSTKLGAEEYLDYESGKVYKRTENALPIPENSTKTDGTLTVTVTGGMYSIRLTGDTSSHKVMFPVKKFFIPKSLDSGGTGAFDLRNGPMNNVHIQFYYEGTQVGYLGLSAQNRFITAYNFGNQFCDAIAIYAVPNSSTTNRTLQPQILTDGSTSSPESYIPYLQPTDPPVSLPAILTYQGENTLSSTETLGETIIKGRINELPTQQSDN